LGWIKNITPLKIRSSLIIFDRYYDDLFVDHRRYRYGGHPNFPKFIKGLLPRPELYFVLTADASLIHQRKKEIPFKELKRQIKGYRSLLDHKRYMPIDVNRRPEQIVLEVTQIIMQKMNERF
jgi:thymidylate kinase